MLEENFGHLLAILERIHGRLSNKQRVLFRHAAQLVVKAVVPNLCHVVPVGHNAVLYGVLDVENAAFRLSLVAYVAVLLPCPHHNTVRFCAPNNGRKHGARRFVVGKASLDAA